MRLVYSTPTVELAKKRIGPLVPDEALPHEIAWWKRKSPEAKKAYLKAHPNSRFGRLQPKDRDVEIAPDQVKDPDAEQPDKGAAKIKSRAYNGLSPKDREGALKKIATNLRESKPFKAIESALNVPVSKWGTKKITEAAGHLREGLKAGGAKKLAKAAGKVLLLAAGTALIGAATVGLGIDVGIYMPFIISKAWEHVTATMKDKELVEHFVAAARKRMKEPISGTDLENAIVDTPGKAKAR